MSAPPAQPPAQSSAAAAGKAADTRVLVDQFLPTYDVGVVHADVFRAPLPGATWSPVSWIFFRPH